MKGNGNLVSRPSSKYRVAPENNNDTKLSDLITFLVKANLSGDITHNEYGSRFTNTIPPDMVDQLKTFIDNTIHENKDTINQLKSGNIPAQTIAYIIYNKHKHEIEALLRAYVKPIQKRLKRQNAIEIPLEGGKPIYKKTNLKKNVFGRERIIYVNAKRKQFVKMNGQMVPVHKS